MKAIKKTCLERRACGWVGGGGRGGGRGTRREDRVLIEADPDDDNGSDGDSPERSAGDVKEPSLSRGREFERGRKIGWSCGSGRE